MPLALGWFLGSVFMLAGMVGGWVAHRANRRSTAALRSRLPTIGTITAVEPPSVDDFGRRSRAIEYERDGRRYRTSAELEARECWVGQTVALLTLPRLPSDAILREELKPTSYRMPILVFCIGAALVAWGYVGELP